LAGLKTRELGAQTLRKLADGYGLEAIATVFRDVAKGHRKNSRSVASE
jgi:hypothetical protein